MSVSVFERLEEIYPEVVAAIPADIFNSHEFMLKLVEEYQELYVQALIDHSQSEQPSMAVVGKITQRLKERGDLVIYLGNKSIENVFEQSHDFEVWQKVQK